MGLRYMKVEKAPRGGKESSGGWQRAGNPQSRESPRTVQGGMDMGSTGSNIIDRTSSDQPVVAQHTTHFLPELLASLLNRSESTSTLVIGSRSSQAREARCPGEEIRIVVSPCGPEGCQAFEPFTIDFFSPDNNLSRHGRPVKFFHNLTIHFMEVMPRDAQGPR
jgi:hypothetical protein